MGKTAYMTFMMLIVAPYRAESRVRDEYNPAIVCAEQHKLRDAASTERYNVVSKYNTLVAEHNDQAPGDDRQNKYIQELKNKILQTKSSVDASFEKVKKIDDEIVLCEGRVTAALDKRKGDVAAGVIGIDEINKVPEFDFLPEERAVVDAEKIRVSLAEAKTKERVHELARDKEWVTRAMSAYICSDEQLIRIADKKTPVLRAIIRGPRYEYEAQQKYQEWNSRRRDAVSQIKILKRVIGRSPYKCTGVIADAADCVTKTTLSDDVWAEPKCAAGDVATILGVADEFVRENGL